MQVQHHEWHNLCHFQLISAHCDVGSLNMLNVIGSPSAGQYHGWHNLCHFQLVLVHCDVGLLNVIDYPSEGPAS